AEPALAIGSYAPLPATGSVLSYLREHGGRRLAIVLNIGGEAVTWKVPDQLAGGTAVLSTTTTGRAEEVEAAVSLGPDEGLILAWPG
ncbi:MAG: alpha-amylase family glycosyl hydrolase, partial [Candidatus Limnocylindria bacterium]